MRSANYLYIPLVMLSLWTLAPLPVCGQGSQPETDREVRQRTVKDFTLPDLQGKPHTPAEWKERKAVVLVFLNTECPVCNFYAPELGRLAKALRAENVLLLGVHPDPYLTVEDARKHAEEYRLGFPILMDPRQVLAAATGVTRTPEVVVLSPGGELRYRGRIDDRYSADGKRREEPRTRDLAEAVKAVVEGKEPVAAQTKAFGCPLPPPKGKQ
jgi:peroxiredoxin